MTVIDIVRANFEARQKLQATLRDIDERCMKEERGPDSDETTEITSVRSQLEAIDQRITKNLEMETRSQQIDDALGRYAHILADHNTGEAVDTRSIGQRFADNDEYRAFAAKGARGEYAVDFDLDFRAVTDTTTGSTSGGALTRPERLTRIGQDFLDRKVFLLDLLPHITTNQGAIEYVQDKTPLADMANKAVEITEGAAKPQAGITTAVVTESMAVVAAWANITRQTAADVPQITSYLDGRLRYSLKRRADLQTISGNGTPPNLKGLTNRSGILTNAPGSSEARYVTIRHSIRLMEDVEQVPEIIVLNPADAELFDLSNSTSAGLHAVEALDENPGDWPTKSAWGLRQVRSTAITSGTALLIDPMAVSVVDRQQATAYMTDSHASNFTSNILTLLLESRLGLALFNPTGVLLCTFNGTT